jgi:hypothetical protein
VDWIDLSHDGDHWLALVNMKCWEFIQLQNSCCLLKEDSVPWSQYTLLRFCDVECDEFGEVLEDAAVTRVF